MATKSNEQIVDLISNLNLLEVAQLVKDLEEKLGVSAAMPVASAAPVAQGSVEAPKAEEAKSEFKVVITSIGAEKVKVMKAIRQARPDLALTDAKNAAEGVAAGTEYVLAEAASKDDAKKMKELLEAAGAKVELR